MNEEYILNCDQELIRSFAVALKKRFDKCESYETVESFNLILKVITDVTIQIVHVQRVHNDIPVYDYVHNSIDLLNRSFNDAQLKGK